MSDESKRDRLLRLAKALTNASPEALDLAEAAVDYLTEQDKVPSFVVGAHVADTVIRETDNRLYGSAEPVFYSVAKRTVRDEIIQAVGLAIMRERGIAQ